METVSLGETYTPIYVRMLYHRVLESSPQKLTSRELVDGRPPPPISARQCAYAWIERTRTLPEQQPRNISDKQWRVLVLRYRDNLTLTAIGRMGDLWQSGIPVTPERVRQVIGVAALKLQCLASLRPDA